ncbi:hypothetical protein [Candidatus Williamhamiltonella defendens]|uniref:hypothetical protein n=1 Tax=Candidatus Williamhamiltonella defendens TaxID=138072 RepID=UPI0016513316|nr:hypothetical protein [Candidatus Hamiltonella defensa]
MVLSEYRSANLLYSVLLSKVLNSVDVIAIIQIEGDLRHMGESTSRKQIKPIILGD